MRISTLKLQHFKNYESARFEFHPRFNCLVGLNGMGKTNLLDSIHYLAFTKSAFSGVDSQHIQHGAPFFALHGVFHDQQDTEVTCYLEQGKKKLIKVNRSEPEKLSDHIGSIPLILTTPYDVAIIQGASDVRRKLVDGTLSQFDHTFLDNLLEYQKILRQRNALLKNQRNTDPTSLNRLLDVYDGRLIPLSLAISAKRRELIQELAPLFESNYQGLTHGLEHTSVEFISEVTEPKFKEDYLAERKRDLLTQRTHLGCHRDDVDFLLGGYSVKKLGSQGQQKTVILALRLAQFDFLSRHTETKPIIMMDDVFDKFDDRRIERLIELLADDRRFQQVLLTDARPERVKRLFEGTSEVGFFEIEKGKHRS